MESFVRTKWFRKSLEFGNLSLEIPQYSTPSDLGVEKQITEPKDNSHFTSFMQAFSILNLEWVLYVNSQIPETMARGEVQEMIDEALNFFSTGEIQNQEVFEAQIEQHRLAADWLENFIRITETSSITLNRTLEGIREYADEMEKNIK